MDHHDAPPSISIWRSALVGSCPRCGEGKLFAGFLGLRPKCERCDLDYGFADAGDGLAVFVILIAGAIVAGAALYVEIAYEPPYWVHAVLWGPLALLVPFALLRPLKALLLYMQYRHRAAEARFKHD